MEHLSNVQLDFGALLQLEYALTIARRLLICSVTLLQKHVSQHVLIKQPDLKTIMLTIQPGSALNYVHKHRHYLHLMILEHVYLNVLI